MSSVPSKYDTFRVLIWQRFEKFVLDPGPEEDAEIIIDTHRENTAIVVYEPRGPGDQ